MFCRRFPAHLLPQVEDALAHLLHGVGEGPWEIVILPVNHAREGDEQPHILPEESDNA